MRIAPKPAPSSISGARGALEKSEKKAFEKEPGEYADAKTAHKVVEVGPDLAQAPIKGIDPKP